MTWDLEEAGDDAVTLHREDGLVLSATRVADDAGTSNRSHRWTEWRFVVTDGDGGDRLAEHGWEIVDEEHLWEVLDGFTYRFRREADVEVAADEREAATPDGESGADPESRSESIAATAEEPGEERVTGPDPTNGAEPKTDGDGAPPDGDVSSPTDTVSDGAPTDDAMGVTPEAHATADRATALAEGVGDVATGSDRATTAADVPTPADATAREQATDASGSPSPDRTTADPAPADAAETDAKPETASASSPSADSTAAGTENGPRVDDPDVTYRPATPADAAELAAVYRSAYAENRELGFPAKAESATADDVRAWIEAHGLLVAVVGDDVVGGVRLEETNPARVKLSRLAVHDDWKGRGIGSGLLDRAEAAVAAGNGETIWLTVPESHPFLPDLYRRRGYERTDEYPLEYRDYDEIVMEKRVG